VLPASERVSRLLKIDLGSQVIARSQDRYIDGIPWSKQTSYYLMDVITKGATKLLMAQDIEEGSVRYLAEQFGIRQTGYRDWITGRLATDDEQGFFGITHNTAVFVMSRVAFDQDNVAMRLTETVFPIDRNQLVIDVGSKVPALTNR
jgi:GntR family transcriptional regulator